VQVFEHVTVSEILCVLGSGIGFLGGAPFTIFSGQVHPPGGGNEVMQLCGLGGAFIWGTSNMPLLPLLVRISLLIAGAFPVLYISTAYGEDVQAYCAKVGNDDSVKTIPAGFVAQARKLFFQPSSAVSDAEVRESTSFRCMSGKIWLCNYGANLVCGKAKVSRESTGATAFCKENPGSDSVPMAATGHDTIYSWKCAGNKARISRQTLTVDPRGFIAENWKRVKR
jgi:hypothetical protein